MEYNDPQKQQSHIRMMEALDALWDLALREFGSTDDRTNIVEGFINDIVSSTYWLMKEDEND